MIEASAYTILNVDDDEAGRYAKSRILKRAGYNVIESDKAADTLKLVLSERPQLVLLDAPFALPERAESESLLASRFAADAAHALGWDADGPDATVSGTADHLDWLARRVAGETGDLDTVRGQIERRFEVFKANSAMIAGFRPAAALRTRTLLISALRSPNAAVQPDWTRLLGRNSTLLPIDADHYSFLRPPQVGEIARLHRSTAQIGGQERRVGLAVGLTSGGDCALQRIHLGLSGL